MSQRAGNDLRAFRWGALASRMDAFYLHPKPTSAGISKAGNDLRAFRRGALASRMDAFYLHPTLSFAKNAGESGTTLMTKQPCPHRNFRRNFPA